ESGDSIELPAMRASDLRGVQSEQTPQDVDLDHSHDGAALVAPQLHILVLDHRHDTTTAFHPWSGPVRYDRHRAGQFVACIAPHAPFISQQEPSESVPSTLA